MSEPEDEEGESRIQRAMRLMRDKDRIVKFKRGGGHVFIEAKTCGDPLSAPEVDHYACRWRGERLLPTYWKERNPLAIEAELVRVEEFEILRRDDVDLD